MLCWTTHTWHLTLGHSSLNVLGLVFDNTISNFLRKLSFLFALLVWEKLMVYPLSCLKLNMTFLWNWYSVAGVICTIYSHGNFRYYIYFVDAYSRFTWIYLLKNKFDALTTLKQFKNMVALPKLYNPIRDVNSVSLQDNSMK